jgi:hypothetical protein
MEDLKRLAPGAGGPRSSLEAVQDAITPDLGGCLTAELDTERGQPRVTRIESRASRKPLKRKRNGAPELSRMEACFGLTARRHDGGVDASKRWDWGQGFWMVTICRHIMRPRRLKFVFSSWDGYGSVEKAQLG